MPSLAFQHEERLEPARLRVGSGEERIARLAFVSDTHLEHRRVGWTDIDDVDVLVHAGDFLVWNAPDAAAELADFADWLGSLRVGHVVLTLGNHEVYFERAGVDPRRYFAERLGADRVSVLVNEAARVTVRGRTVVFWASPNTPQRGALKRANAHTSGGAELARLWDGIPADVDVLVTHCPPFWILDEARAGLRYGAASLLRWHEATPRHARPKIHAFGHCHERFGYVADDATLFLNAAAPFGRRRSPHVIDLH